MPKLDLKIHPPIVLACCCVIAWIISKTFEYQVEFNGYIQLTAAIALVMVGVAVAANAIFQFHRASTTVDPTKPSEASTLVTIGVYKFTRNPMYLGLLLVLVGWIVFLGNLFGAIAIVVFIIYITKFQIRPEEQIMALKFGEAYSKYCQNVRRWI